VAAVMEFGLLGPLLVRQDGAAVPVSTGKQRALLVALLLNANRPVPTEQLAEVLWGPSPPPSARASLHNHVMRLRKALADADHSRIAGLNDGYMINVRTGELDVERFEASLSAAREAARGKSWAEAADLLRTALTLWRGQPLSGVPPAALMLQEAPRLAEMRLQALESRIDADLHLGRHAEVIAELGLLAAANPLREHVRALLMLALYRCGRQAEALAAYQQARSVLVDEVGIEPGNELRELHQRILADDPELTGPAWPAGGWPASPAEPGAGPAAVAGSEPGLVVPRELPGSAPYFVGREGELATLTEELDQAGSQAPGTVIISAIGGMAGVGKTALAVHWAHQNAGRFPDGQLYVNLRGFDASGTPVTPAEAIRGFLDATGVPPERIPPGLAAQAGLYRSLVAGRRMLIVLDNAHDEQQIRPLLPAGPGCMVIVTSRRKLAGLAAAEGARLLTLGVLSHSEARRVLAARLGAERAAAEPHALDEAASLCGHLPLALAVAAARAAASPDLSLASLADELRGARNRLDALDTGDPAASVQAVFSWSYQQLSATAARMFRLLGLHPGPDISAPAAASLAGTSLGEAVKALGELTHVHLVTEHFPGRYGFHDLLRAYAAEQARGHEANEARQLATSRILDHYLHTIYTARPLLMLLDPIALAPPAPGVTPELLSSPQQAFAWFDAEYHVLLAAVGLAAETGFDTCAWQLPWSLSRFLDRRCHWYQWAAVQRIALAAATRLDDTHAVVISVRMLACACARLGDYDQAETLLADCLLASQRIGDLDSQCRIHQCLSWIAGTLQDRYADALSHSERALALSRAAGNQIAEAENLNAVGWSHAMLGHYQHALTFCQQALDKKHELGNHTDAAYTWDSLGYIHHHLGQFAEAADCYSRSLNLLRYIGDRFNEAEILSRLGDTYQAAGELPRARIHWQQALEIFTAVHHPHARQIRAKLAGSDGQRQRAAAAPEPAAR
jgi:DNA-binding SARP family transcriptional activator